MEGQRLIHAVRHHDVAAVNEQLKGETTVDVNIEVEVEGSAFLPQEDPVFRSTPLVEGVRSRCPEVIHALLAIDGVDVNKRTTTLNSTAFCDACFRGDVDMATLLLQDPRVDPNLGDDVVSHPALYPCMTGNIGLLRVFAEAGLMGDDLEGPLLEVAAANAQRAATAFIEAHYIDSRPMERLPSTQQAEKIRRVCNRVDPSSSGMTLAEYLPAICHALGAEMFEDELKEMRRVLTLAGLQSTSGRQQFRVEDLVTFWLSMPDAPSS